MNKVTMARLLAIPAFAMATGAARAELPAAVTSAITEAGSNLSTAAVAIIAALAAFWGLQKLGRKLGLW